MARIRENDPRPPYVQIADELRSQIAGGKLAPGDRLASVRVMAEDYGVAQMTIWQAFKLLKAENLLVSWRGRGVFVSDGTQEAEPGGPTDETLEAVLDRLAELEARVEVLEGKAKRSKAR